MKNSNAAVLKRGYRMHLRCQIKEKTKFMKNFRSLRYLIYRLSIYRYNIPVNFIKNSQVVFKYQQFKDFIQILFIKNWNFSIDFKIVVIPYNANLIPINISYIPSNSIHVKFQCKNNNYRMLWRDFSNREGSQDLSSHFWFFYSIQVIKLEHCTKF